MRPQQGDLILAREAPVGQVVRVPQEPRVCLGQRTVLIRPNPAVVEPRFLHYWLLGPAAQQVMTSIAAGATVPHLNVADIRALDISEMPRSLTQQAFVAETLGSIDDLIENNRRRVEVLEEMARAIYREWFVYFRYPGHEDVPLVDSPLGPIPESWVQGVLGDLAEIDRKNIQPSKSPEELFDHYSIPAFDNGQRPAVDVGATIKSGKYLLSSQAVLVSKLNPRIDRVWFADPSEERRSVCSTEFLVLRPTARSSLDHLYLLSRDAVFRNQLTALSGGTSGSHQRAKPKDFLNLPVQVPPTDLVRDLDDAVGDQLRCARLLRCQSEQVACLRDLLLPKLVTGQIDVSHLDIDALTEAATA